jgi:iron complex transport system permease protein
MSSKQRNIFLILFFFLLTGILLNLAMGSVSVPLTKVLSAIFGGETDNVFEKIVWQLRMPKMAAAILAGASLSLSGLLMQTFFRNPIAGPFVLGISSGAGLGAAVWIMGAGWLASLGLLSNPDFLGAWGMIIASSLGAALVLILLLSVSWRIADISTLLILGMMLGSAVGALVMLLQFFSGREELQRFVLWSMGDLGGLNGTELAVLSTVCLIGMMIAFFLSQPLNVLLLGEENAKALGVDIKKLRWMLIITTAILAGSITAFCGPISFIGIAVPHAARMLWRTQRHQLLIPGTILLGAVVMLYCQLLSTLPFTDKILPINVITSLLGAPAVVWIVLSVKK